MNIEWLWDRNLKLEEVKNILHDEKHHKFVEMASILLSRNNVPREIFDNFIDKQLFVENWHRIKRQMRKDKWNDPRITFWQAVYEKLLQIFNEKGIRFRSSISEVGVNELCQEVGDQIRQIREEGGVTQAELAFKMGISQQIISRVEKGRENIGLETLKKIAHALNRKIYIDMSINKPDSSKIDGLDSILLLDNLDNPTSRAFNPIKDTIFLFNKSFDTNGTN